MSRPGASEPKNWATNNLRSGLVSQVAGGLLSRFGSGWSMSPRQDRQLVIQTVLLALWQRPARTPVIQHSNRGCQFTSEEYQQFLEVHNGTSFGLIDIEAMVTAACEVKEWISAHALKR
jgi:putative transposase